MESLTSDTILTKIQNSQRNIKQYGVIKIGLFGSFINGSDMETSDIDILVEFDVGKKTFDNYMGLKFFLEDLFKRPVDLVISEAVKKRLKPFIFGSVQYAAGL